MKREFKLNGQIERLSVRKMHLRYKNDTKLSNFNMPNGIDVLKIVKLKLPLLEIINAFCNGAAFNNFTYLHKEFNIKQEF